MGSHSLRLLLAALLVFAGLTGCGTDKDVALDSDDTAQAVPGSSTSDGEVHVYTANHVEATNPAKYLYQRTVEQAAWSSTGSPSFDRLQTYQYQTDSAHPFEQIAVKSSDSNYCWNAYNGAKFEVARDDGTIPDTIFKKGDALPAQITFMKGKKNDTGKSCGVGNVGPIDASSAIAVWLSVDDFWKDNMPANATICNLEALQWGNEIKNPYETKVAPSQYWPKNNTIFHGSTPDCVIDQISYHKYGTKPDGEDDWVYGGTLFTMLTDQAANDAKKPLFINLGDHQVFMAKSGQVLSSSYRDSDGVYKMIDTQRPIFVTGTSVIDGSGAPDGRSDHTPACYDECPLSDMLVLGSDFTPDGNIKSAIDITGISVANAPPLGHSAVRLNDANLSMWKPGTAYRQNAGNKPIKAWDFKRPGTWATASDGIEPGGDNSYVGYAYMNVNDDSIKVAADVKYENITLLQGAAGSAINVGSYGYTRGVRNATIDGVYVHRIASGGAGGDDDSHAALIATRTCGFKAIGGANLEVKGVKISNVYVNSLGSDAAGHAFNEVWRVFAIGVQGGNSDRGKFCTMSKKPMGPVTMGDWTMTNINVFMDPLRKSQMYYELPDTGNSWGPFRFCTPDPQNSGQCAQPPPGPGDPDSPVTMFKNGGYDGGGYYVCGAPDPSGCWTVDKNKNPVKSGSASNVDYDATTDWSGKLIFPYG